MTRVIRAAAFVLVLSVYAHAGIIQADKTEPPPPPPPATTAGVTQEETGMEVLIEGTMQFDLADAASRAALASLQSLLTLF